MSQTDNKTKYTAVTSGTAKKQQTAKKTKKIPGVIKLYLGLLIIACVAGVIISIVSYFGKDKIKRNASVSIEFTYDGAAQNKTPGGEQFSINGITSEHVLSDALEIAGFKEKYTIDDLRSGMVVSGVYPQNVINRIKQYDSLYDFSESRTVSLDDYYPTVYSITLYDEFDSSISDSDLKKIVESIALSYKAYFINKYSYAYDMTDYNGLLKITDYDYTQRVKILKLRLGLLERYSGEMYKTNTSFRKNGISFNDIMLKASHIENESLSRTEATIITDVLTVSSARLRNQYEYEIQILENEKTYKNANLEEINALIDSYQTDGILYIPAGETVVKVESNSKATYEKLTDKKVDISKRLVEIDSEIERYNSYLEDLKKATYTASSKNDSIDSKLKEIEENVNELEKSFDELVKEYNNSIVNESSVVLTDSKFSGAKLLSGSFVVSAVKRTAPLCIIVFLICCIHMFFIENRKYRAEQKAKM